MLNRLSNGVYKETWLGYCIYNMYLVVHKKVALLDVVFMNTMTKTAHGNMKIIRTAHRMGHFE